MFSSCWICSVSDETDASSRRHRAVLHEVARELFHCNQVDMHKDGNQRDHCAAASSAPMVLEECRWNWVKHKAWRDKGKTEKNTEEQIKKLKERRSCIFFAPASLRQRNSSLGLAAKQLLSLWRQFQCQLVINAWIITSPQIAWAYSQNVKNTEKQTDVESISLGNISN